MKADTICCSSISKRMTKEAFMNHCMLVLYMARPTAHEVGIYPPLFEEPCTLVHSLDYFRVFTLVWQVMCMCTPIMM